MADSDINDRECNLQLIYQHDLISTATLNTSFAALRPCLQQRADVSSDIWLFSLVAEDNNSIALCKHIKQGLQEQEKHFSTTNPIKTGNFVHANG